MRRTEQAAEPLTAVRDQSPRGRRLSGFFGCMYYAAARPHGGHRATTPGLRPAAPRLGHSSAQADTAAIGLSVDGQRRSARQAGLQHRSSKTVRPVRIPPELVALLHWHVTAYGTAPDGRLFQTQRGGLIQDGGYGEVWAEARSCALTAA